MSGRWQRNALDVSLPVSSDQRAVLTTELGADGASDQLVWVGRDQSGAFAKSVLAPVPTQAYFVSNVSADASDTPTTTAISTFQQAYSQSVTLPAGTWAVYANGWLALKNSAGNSGALRIQIDGVAGGTRTVPLNSTTFQTLMCHAANFSVSGGRTISVLMEFHGTTSGTTSAQNPALWIACQRGA